MSTKAYLGSRPYSDACSPKGNGQCDGIVAEGEEHEGEECGCQCHAAWAGPEYTEARTVAEMAAAHAENWRLYGPANA